MKTFLKCVLLFFTLITLIIVSCSEDEPLYMTEKPVAHAGADQLVEIYDNVYLDGSFSTKSENVEYIWSFDYKPPGSTIAFSDSTVPNPKFVANAGGFYNVQLVVKINEFYSEPDYTIIQSVFKKSREYFPQKVGNKWKYKVIDRAGEVKDTINIEVVGTTILPNGEQATIWNFSDADYVYPYYHRFDSLYLVTRGDTLTYYDVYRNTQNPFLSYIVPFQVGDSLLVKVTWVSFITVDGRNSISLDIGTFQNAFQVKHFIPKYDLLSPGFLSYNWMVPGIGLVKMDLHQTYSIPPIIQSEEHWELIWYNLVE